MSAIKQSALRLTGVAKRFGRIKALQPIDLSVSSDELVVILGPTGAGKTTLLRLIAGLETPDNGDIAIDGVSALPLSPAQRDVALVFQNFSLYPDWTVRENLAFPLRAPGRRLPEVEIAERIAWVSELLRIGVLLDRPATRLSGGEMQRVAIGRAIVRRPRLFLLDEPLTNLDAKLREALRVELVALRRSLGIPMIFVTHDPLEALSMADRIVVLSEGRVLQEGPPAEVYRKPVSPVVARQLGQPPINILEVVGSADGWRTADGTLVLAATEGAGERAVIGIRPESVTLTGGVTPGAVRVVEHTGPALIIVVAWAGVELRALVPKSHTARPGETVYPCLDASHALLWKRSE